MNEEEIPETPDSNPNPPDEPTPPLQPEAEPPPAEGETGASGSGPEKQVSSAAARPNPFAKFFGRLIHFFTSSAGLKTLLVILILAGGAYAAYYYFFLKPKKAVVETAPEKAAKKVIGINGFKVGRYNYEDSLNALGTIKGGVEFKLSFEIPGIVSAINYREGERYEEGALLISLKQDDILLRLKRAQAQRNKADTQVAIAKTKLKEHQKLFAMGAIPKMTLDKVQLEVDSTRYELEAADLEVKANEVMLEKSNLYAPTSGTIGELNVEEGEAVTQNTLVGTHLSTDYVLAEFGVTEKDLNKLSLGQKARVFVDAYADKTFEGTIEGVGSVVIGSSRTANVKIRIENPENLLVPGMFARIKILLYQKKNALVVPTDALRGKEKNYHVLVVDEETKMVHQQPVVVGYQRKDYAQIDSGVREGDIVAITALDRLEEGAKVRVIEVQEAEL